MQEVQKTLDYKAELNLIEWVWHQENRIKEHTQVEAAFSYSCTVYWQANYFVDTSESRQSTTNQWTLSITEEMGITKFKIEDWWLRIPLAWPYLVEISLIWGWTNYLVTNYIKVWDKTVFELQTNSATTTVTNEIILNLGKYDIISFRWNLYYSGTAWSASGYSRATIKIKRL